MRKSEFQQVFIITAVLSEPLVATAFLKVNGKKVLAIEYWGNIIKHSFL